MTTYKMMNVYLANLLTRKQRKTVYMDCYLYDLAKQYGSTPFTAKEFFARFANKPHCGWGVMIQHPDRDIWVFDTAVARHLSRLANAGFLVKSKVKTGRRLTVGAKGSHWSWDIRNPFTGEMGWWTASQEIDERKTVYTVA